MPLKISFFLGWPVCLQNLPPFVRPQGSFYHFSFPINCQFPSLGLHPLLFPGSLSFSFQSSSPFLLTPLFSQECIHIYKFLGVGTLLVWVQGQLIYAGGIFCNGWLIEVICLYFITWPGLWGGKACSKYMYYTQIYFLQSWEARYLY